MKRLIRHRECENERSGKRGEGVWIRMRDVLVAQWPKMLLVYEERSLRHELREMAMNCEASTS
jgi:hypothetical protein